MRRWILLLIGMVLAFTALGCATQKPVVEEGVGVVVTILPQADFVEKVAGDRVHITVMIPPGASPETYEPTAKQLQEVSRAKMYFKVGSGLPFERVWMDKIVATNPHMIVVNGSENITIMDNDPHVWNSPPNAKKMVETLYDGLVRMDPANASYYTANRDAYLKELDALDEYIHQKLDRCTNRAFLVYHPAFGYFANEYNLTQIAVERGGKEPTPQVIQTCIEQAERYNLSYVYVEPQFSTREAQTIADAIGGSILYMDPLPRDYIANMRKVASSLSLECEG